MTGNSRTRVTHYLQVAIPILAVEHQVHWPFGFDGKMFGFLMGRASFKSDYGAHAHDFVPIHDKLPR